MVKSEFLLTMATGAGKTFVAFQISMEACQIRIPTKGLIIWQTRIFLRDQAYNEFAPFEDARAI
ncbi:MAG: hypothetical protein KIIPBIDF_01526 [Candidatus Methanoperedenaceae archaeon GB50]|nr:MAG: hypothetical protein KIIPBIDF_01526 [Candidatus Methanoperedenaceae archaeon GB50]